MQMFPDADVPERGRLRCLERTVTREGPSGSQCRKSGQKSVEKPRCTKTRCNKKSENLLDRSNLEELESSHVEGLRLGLGGNGENV